MCLAQTLPAHGLPPRVQRSGQRRFRSSGSPSTDHTPDRALPLSQSETQWEGGRT
jgi:hypothetical protein